MIHGLGPRERWAAGRCGRRGVASDVVVLPRALHASRRGSQDQARSMQAFDNVDSDILPEGCLRQTPLLRNRGSGHDLDALVLVITYEEYHPFGTTSWWATDGGTDVSAKRYRYTGKERDDETGLGYPGARYYAAWLGRWERPDPAGMVDGPNRWRYARQSLGQGRDPTGLATTDLELEAKMIGRMPTLGTAPHPSPDFMIIGLQGGPFTSASGLPGPIEYLIEDVAGLADRYGVRHEDHVFTPGMIPVPGVTDDVADVVRNTDPNTRIVVIGFSMGGEQGVRLSHADLDGRTFSLDAIDATHGVPTQTTSVGPAVSDFIGYRQNVAVAPPLWGNELLAEDLTDTVGYNILVDPRYFVTVSGEDVSSNAHAFIFPVVAPHVLRELGRVFEEAASEAECQDTPPQPEELPYSFAPALQRPEQ
ncbi:MAG: RHS repeat-associated core domain-containing protein [Alphaproteobacteria bacterium]|nr:RHS repeat-associated core domain-containing protein [Alphaproteobacteria bacterium]